MSNITIINKTPYHYIKREHSLCGKFREDIYEVQLYVCQRLFDFLDELKVVNKEILIVQRTVLSVLIVLRSFNSVNCRLSEKCKIILCNEIVKGNLFNVLSKHLNIFNSTVQGKRRIPIYLAIKTKSACILYTISKCLKDK